MEPLAKLQNRARAYPQKIVLADGEDDRAIAAAARAVTQNFAKLTLLGRSTLIRATADRLGLKLDGIEIIDPSSSPRLSIYAEILWDHRRSTGTIIEEAYDLARMPLYFAALRVAAGDANAAIAGRADAGTDLSRVGRDSIGLASDSRILSSCSLLMLQPQNAAWGQTKTVLCADCNVISNPSEQDLAEIAISTADNARELLEAEPRVALLASGSKIGSNRIREAIKIVKARAPELIIDGELQADVALNPSADNGGTGSRVAGRANVLIFPDLDSANIACKLLESVAAASVLGPLLQGLQKPFNGCSRSASIDDIAGTIAITAVQAISQKQRYAAAGN
jgi:phosphate acetyltransferase